MPLLHNAFNAVWLVVILSLDLLIKTIGDMDMTNMHNLAIAMKAFWHDGQGQDLIEYTLLLAFVALATAAIFLVAGGSISGIWSTTNSQLVAASSSAS